VSSIISCFAKFIIIVIREFLDNILLGAKVRGTAVAAEKIDELFEANDERIRVECEVIKGEKFFVASAL
jgi:hypothetical protein